MSKPKPRLTRAAIMKAAENLVPMGDEDILLLIPPENWERLPDDIKEQWLADGTVVFVPGKES